MSPASKKSKPTTGPESHGAGRYCYEYPRPAVTVDIVLFKIVGSDIQVLLIKRANNPFKGRWAFPGGFVDEFEPLEAAARRELEEETSLTNVTIEQVRAFGDPGRDPRGHTVSVMFAGVVEGRAVLQGGADRGGRKLGGEKTTRVGSRGGHGGPPVRDASGQFIPRAGDDAKEAKWRSIKRPLRLAFDHDQILKVALEHVFGVKASTAKRRDHPIKA